MTSNTQKNIANLISVWKTAGNAFNQYFKIKELEYCKIQGSEWPNRIWFNEVPSEKILTTLTEIIDNSSVPLSVTHLDNFKSSLLFERFGFAVKSQQTGMSLQLRTAFNNSEDIQLKRVIDDQQATLWTELYPQSFGYNISADILIKTKEQISFYLIYKNQEPVGTIITHITDKVLGVHGLGILPQFRKQGLAEEVMAVVINQAISENIQLVTLQSSAMGKGIYKKMGFSEDFLMTSYLKIGKD